MSESVVDGKITLSSTDGDEPYDDVEMNQCVVASECTVLDSQEEARRASVRASMSADIQNIKDRARRARTSLSQSIGAVSVRDGVDSPVENPRSIPTRTISVPIEVTTFPTVPGNDFPSFRDSITSLDVSDVWYADQRSRTSGVPHGTAVVQDTSPLSVFSQAHHVRHPSGGSTHSMVSLGSGDVQAMQERARQVAALALPGMRAIHDSFDDGVLEQSSFQNSGGGKHVRHSSCDSSQRMLSLASCDIQAMKVRARRGRSSITQPGAVMFRDDDQVTLDYSEQSPKSGQELPPRPSGSSVYSETSSKDHARADFASMYAIATLEHSPTTTPYENAHSRRSSSPAISPMGQGSGEIQAMKERARRSRNSIVYPGTMSLRDGNEQPDHFRSGPGAAEENASAIAGLKAEANYDGSSHSQWVTSDNHPKADGAVASADSNWVNPFMESERPSSGRMAQDLNLDSDEQRGIRRQPSFPLYSADNRSMRLVRVQSVADLDKVVVLPYVNRKLCLVGAAILCLVITAVSIGVGVTLSNHAAGVPSDPATGTTVSEACLTAGDSEGQSTRFVEFSEMFGLSDPNTASRKATCWLADADKSQIPTTDLPAAEKRFALAVLYFSTISEGGDGSSLTNWLSEGSECGWQGVTCDNEDIVSLGLSGIGLVGSIPPEVSLLSSLSELLLDKNRLTGSIPDEIYQLTSLSILNLEQNSLEGSLSERIGNMTMLQTLSLGENILMTGVLPDKLFSLTGLGTLIFLSIL